MMREGGSGSMAKKGRGWVSGLWLLALGGILCAIGAAFIESASYDPESGTYAAFGAKQRMFMVPALLAFLAIGLTPFRWLRSLSWPGYLAAIALLCGLPFFGELSNGARSWYRVGPLAFQPSEVAKLGCVLLLGNLLARSQAARAWWGPAIPALVFGPAFVLIALQPDLGSAIVLIPPALGMLFVAGVRKRVLVALLLGGLATVPVALLSGSLETHQVERIESFLHPERDPQGKGFQAIQSRIAIGATARARRPSSGTCPTATPTSSSASCARKVASRWGPRSCWLSCCWC
jgi:rod shape determining protein RodA